MFKKDKSSVCYRRLTGSWYATKNFFGGFTIHIEVTIRTQSPTDFLPSASFCRYEEANTQDVRALKLLLDKQVRGLESK